MSLVGLKDLPRLYDLVRFPFMAKAPEFMPRTETYVSIPPALHIRDQQNNVWTLGFDYDEREWRTGRLEYDIVCNGKKTGEFGRIIEYRNDSYGTPRIRIFGAYGGRATWRWWSGHEFV